MKNNSDAKGKNEQQFFLVNDIRVKGAARGDKLFIDASSFPPCKFYKARLCIDGAYYDFSTFVPNAENIDLVDGFLFKPVDGNKQQTPFTEVIIIADRAY
jgi:hypothetical protein